MKKLNFYRYNPRELACMVLQGLKKNPLTRIIPWSSKFRWCYTTISWWHILQQRCDSRRPTSAHVLNHGDSHWLLHRFWILCQETRRLLSLMKNTWVIRWISKSQCKETSLLRLSLNRLITSNLKLHSENVSIEHEGKTLSNFLARQPVSQTEVPVSGETCQRTTKFPMLNTKLQILLSKVHQKKDRWNFSLSFLTRVWESIFLWIFYFRFS